MNKDPLEQNFGRLHSLHVAALTRHLIECRKVCDGDFDLFLVLTIIGERSFAPRNVPQDMGLAEWRDAAVSSVETEAINLQSIADYSGIPKETVRRKIDVLIAKGWVRRDHHKFVTATDIAKDDLDELTQSSIRYLRELGAALRPGG